MAYNWVEYASDDRFIGGKMFFVKFGRTPRAPIWPVDILSEQVADAQTIIRFMLADALNGFPVPFLSSMLTKSSYTCRYRRF